MPDAAVEAAKYGLPYTEPRTPGLKSRLKSKAKITYVNDPNNPLAPPRRIIEKMGFWERILGPSSRSEPTPPLNYTPPLQKSIWSTTPRPLPPITTTPNQPAGTTAYRLTPFPDDFGSLPKEEKKAWERQRKEEVKFLKALEKEQRAAERAEGARKVREAGVLRKQQAEEIKARQNAIKLEKKLGYRPMPEYIPPKYPTCRPLPPITQPQPNANPGLGQPSSWMLLPTLEQFGVRRPFDAPGQVPDKIHTIGGTEWPMMSRTMTHAMLDMSREERVHLDQAGHSWSPAWYRD